MDEKLQIIKITNPVAIGTFSPLLIKFLEITKIPGMAYENLYSYFALTVHNKNAEVCVVMDNTKPVGFGLWYVKGLPYAGLACCDFIYSHNRKRGIFKLLAEKFIEFGKEHRCPYYECTAVNETVSTVLEKMAKKLGLNVKKLDYVTMFGWRNK